MLILTRRVKETLVIDKTNKLTILGVKGNQIRLGIDAPSSVKILREELALASQEKPNLTSLIDNGRKKKKSSR